MVDTPPNSSSAESPSALGIRYLDKCYEIFYSNNILKKVWSLCTECGAGVWFEPYCGSATDISDEGLGQGPNVVLGLVQKSGLGVGSQVFFDNLFTSFPLLQHLSAMGIAGTGTVRQNRLNRIPIIKKKEMEKKTIPRGQMEAIYQADQVLVAWKDNKAVYMASNKFGAELGNPCRRFNRTEKRYDMVQCPKVIGKYNISHLVKICIYIFIEIF